MVNNTPTYAITNRAVFNNTNIVNNIGNYARFHQLSALNYSNSFANRAGGIEYSVAQESNQIADFKSPAPSYLGSSDNNKLRRLIIDGVNPMLQSGNTVVNLDYVAKEPIREAHGIVWKVVVNGYDAQDEFEMLPPLGAGKHKFEVYFNRPMDTSVTPHVAMGVREPYTQNPIAEDGSWSADSTIYTAYLTITGKTQTDGLNRIYVNGAEDNEHFEIPVEKYRFNVPKKR